MGAIMPIRLAIFQLELSIAFSFSIANGELMTLESSPTMPPMQINLPTVTLAQKGERITVTHKAKRFSVEVSRAALDRWCVARLRAELSPKKPSIQGAK